MNTDLKVYWRPGCSSCVKVKEFLAQQGVAYESIDVAARPEAMQELLALGVKTVPVVARGGEYVFAQALEDVSRFIGKEVEFRRLPPQALMDKWLTVLRAAQRHARQLPVARLHERAVESRNRSIRDLAYHVYQIPDAFLQAVQDGVENLVAVYDRPAPANVVSPDEIVAYGRSMERKLEAWWRGLADKSCRQTVRTYYGQRPLHELLERLGIEPDRPLTAADYAGLPMPKGLWE